MDFSSSQRARHCFPTCEFFGYDPLIAVCSVCHEGSFSSVSYFHLPLTCFFRYVYQCHFGHYLGCVVTSVQRTACPVNETASVMEICHMTSWQIIYLIYLLKYFLVSNLNPIRFLICVIIQLLTNVLKKYFLLHLKALSISFIHYKCLKFKKVCGLISCRDLMLKSPYQKFEYAVKWFLEMKVLQSSYFNKTDGIFC